MIRVTIPIVPKAQARHRSRLVKTRDGRVFTHVHKAKDQRVQEDNFRALLYKHQPETLLDEALLLEVHVFLPIPKAWSKKKKRQAQMGELRSAGKPDLSNYIKQVEDVCTGVFWTDDKLVVGVRAGKHYDDGKGPRWEIEIQTVEERGETLDRAMKLLWPEGEEGHGAPELHDAD